MEKIIALYERLSREDENLGKPSKYHDKPSSIGKKGTPVPQLRI